MIREKIKLSLNPSDISTAHHLGTKPKNQEIDRRSIIKLCRREMRRELILACKKIRPNFIFINENLTSNRSSILFCIRKAKRTFLDVVSNCGSFDGRVYVCTKPPNPESPGARNSRVNVNTREQLQTFCQRTLKIDV